MWKKRKTNLRKHCCQGFTHLDKCKTLEKISRSFKYSLRTHKDIKQGHYWSFLTWKRRKKRGKKRKPTHQPAGGTTMGVEFPYWWWTFPLWKRQYVHIYSRDGVYTYGLIHNEKDHRPGKDQKSGETWENSATLSYGTDEIRHVTNVGTFN